MFYDNEKSSQKLKKLRVRSKCESVLVLQPWYERGPGHKPECFCDKLELSEGGWETLNVAFDGAAVVVAVALDHTLLAFCSGTHVIGGKYCLHSPRQTLTSLSLV